MILDIISYVPVVISMILLQIIILVLVFPCTCGFIGKEHWLDECIPFMCCLIPLAGIPLAALYYYIRSTYPIWGNNK
jgi:hypothetical protein